MHAHNPIEHDRYDVIVIGGGPAGATTATLTAEAGLQTLLVERSDEPAFKVGESLIPATYWIFERLGMLEKLKASHFPEKYSVQFYSGSGKASAPFYFSQTNPHESSMTWQVLRSEFDQMMLDNAQEQGVAVHRGVSVHQVLFEGDQAIGVRAKQPDGQMREITAKVLVDSTGQSALISRKLKISNTEQQLRKASIFTHFENGKRDDGIDEGATLILNTRDKDSWFWYIPLPYNRVSVGVVGDLDYLLQNREGNVQTVFYEEVEKCLSIKERLTDANQMFPVKVTKDFSYRASQIAGDGWVLVGDAFGFVDPVYSTGLFLALKSGEMAADAIIAASEQNDFSAKKLGTFEPELVAGMETFRKLVYAFYTKEFSFGTFLRQHPECQQGVIDILSGDVFKDSVNAIFEPMGKMCQLPGDLGFQPTDTEER